MKRKFLTLMFVLLILPCAFLLTACATNVAGKSYEFDTISAEVNKDISSEDLSKLAVRLKLDSSASREDVEKKLNSDLKSFADAMKDKENSAYFNTNGKLVVVMNDVKTEYVWKQNGNVVTVNEVFEDGTVDGGKTAELKVVSASRICVDLDDMSGDGYQIKMYYKVVS